jgi:hypothetical protein
MRPDHRGTFDTESLQADVMRFMAIIAFCLIAILALVQKLPEATKMTEVASPLEFAAVEVPVPEPDPSPPIIAEKMVPAAVPVPAVEAAAVPITEVVRHEAPDPLVLKFESDKAFLSLISDGRITLISLIDQNFYAMNREFKLTGVKPAGELHELMAATLPRRVAEVVARAGEATRYLVALPEVTRNQVRQLSEQHESQGGALLINALGEVTYVD